ncbi:guanylate kinase [Desulfogranum marinum]|uniref:guanylate kinase n=1 Tax=Desulfogranum marinum TaxID=453220 RepID=UPI001962852E|nr:guanylate kinase [Desulfogranum marinum]MBM9513737.1 guanylate kinase [Desulfogranum marinum]
MSSGTLFVLSAPSGCGKTTMVREVMRQLPNLVFSISHTTRQPRNKEQHGVNYYFVSPDAFIELRDREPSGFLEWAEVHGNFYGTSKQEVEQQQAAGKDVILDIDVQGAGQVMSKASPVTIFIAPPSMQELERRLRGRGTEDDATISLRMQNAKKEMEAAVLYDYLIVNDVLEEAIDCLKSIIIAERCRCRKTTLVQGL